MPTEMKNLKIDKVDLVDRGAQGEFVAVRLYKRDDEAHDDAKSRDQRAERSDEGAPMTTRLSDAQKADLPDEVVKAFEALEDELTKAKEGAAEQGDDDIAKRDDLPEDVRKRFEEQEARIAKAEAVAAHEREMRVRKEWADKVTSLENLPQIEVAKGEDSETLTDRLFEIAKTDEDLADSIFSTLKALDEQIRSDELFAEIGKRGGTDEDSPEGRLEKVVKGYVEKDGLTEPEAWAKALQTHADEYEAYVASQQEG